MLAVMLLATSAPAQPGLGDTLPEFNDRPKHSALATTTYQANLKKHKGASDFLVLPGLVANRKTQRVEVMAEATGIGAKTIVEFLLIDASSNKGYEALLWSHARPSDIHRALEFIGMKAGNAFHPGELRYWAKGERVVTTIAVGDDEIPLESLIIDNRTGRRLPAVGFVFAGSSIVNPPGNPAQKLYAADIVTPKSIASLYNNTTAVLDVPRRAFQGDIYGTQIVGSRKNLRKNELVTITLKPELTDGRRRVIDLNLKIRGTKPEPAKLLEAENDSSAKLPFEFLLTDETGKSITPKPQLANVLGKFESLVRQGRDTFVSIEFDSALTLEQVKHVCKFIDAINSDGGIRVEPPAKNQLYYKALLPDRKLLNPARRVVDPWEVHCHLNKETGDLAATLRLLESTYVGGESKTKETKLAVESGKELRRQLDADAARRKNAGRRPGPTILLVFAEPNTTYGQLLRFLASAMSTHNEIHVFVKSTGSE
jgi:hypothetical protein